ncbi:hypothetical protein [Aliivibrio salmonicida]|uniref:hypothetical protein n=1 Tax=Aliivibrio salmonicida TaxID=40269 RepID=UPI003D10E8DA
MNEVQQRYSESLHDTQRRAGVMRTVLIAPIGLHSDITKRNNAVMEAAKDVALFSSMGKPATGILLSSVNAIVEYANNNHGLFPTDDMLASAHQTWENLYEGNETLAAASASHILLSSVGEANLSSESGVAIRSVTAALTLPTILSNPMNVVCAYLPTRKHSTEVFNMDRVAGSTLGDYTKGQVIDALTVGQYSRQRQRYNFATAQQPDGTKKQYIFTPKTDTPAKRDLPLREGSVVIRFNKRVVAKQHEESGDIFGKIHIGETAFSVTGSVDQEKGIITVDTNAALPEDTILTAQYEVKIEGNPDLIPTISHKMSSFKLRPHARTLSSSTSAMANFAMQVEFGVDLFSLDLSSVRNEMVNEKAKYQLVDLMDEVTEVDTFNAAVPADSGETWKDRFEYFMAKLITLDTKMKALNKESGIKAVYAGTQFSAFLQMLPGSMFTRSDLHDEASPRIHKIGTLLNRIQVFEVPMNDIVSADDALLCGRTDKLGKAPYYTGDVIPPTIYKHDKDNGLTKTQTVWAQGYDEASPDCWKYLIKVTLQNFNQ